VTGPLLLLGALVAGILTGDALGPSAAWLQLGLAALGLVGAWGLHRWGPTRAALVVAASATLLGGVAVEQRALHGVAVSPLASLVHAGASTRVDVTLLEDPAGPAYRTEALARVDAVGGAGAGGRIVLLAASGDEQSVLRVLAAGERLRLRGTFGPLTGWSTRLRWRHAVGQLTLDEARAVAPPAGATVRIANALRALVLRGADVLPPTPRALLVGFVLGDTRAIPPELVADFRDAGLSHLLAVSGANVAFALAIAEPVLRRMRLGPRFAGGSRCSCCSAR
jgi:competence protein ComEC